MIELKAISTEEDTEAQCELVKLNMWIHPEDHTRVRISIYLEIRNTGRSSINEITLYFPPSTQITEMEDRTVTYTPKYRNFIGASLKPENRPAEYLSQKTKRSNEVVVRYKKPILPKEYVCTLFMVELRCSLEKTSLVKRIITREKAWEFRLWTWRKAGILKSNHKFPIVKEEDIWVMIPKTLYRSSEFLRSVPTPRLSRPLAQEEIIEGKYDEEWVRAGTYCLNWNVNYDIPVKPRQQMYSVQHITQDIPALSLIALFASIVTLFSLSMSVKPILYFFLALAFIFAILIAVIYSYSFFQFSFSTRSILLGIQSFIGGMFFGLSFIILKDFWVQFTSFPHKGLLLLVACILATLGQIYLQARMYFKTTMMRHFLSTAISHTTFSFLATFLILFLFQKGINSFSIGYFSALAGICLLGGVPTEWVALLMSERVE